MRYWLSFDGGGTKLEAVLFDERLNIAGYARVHGINSNFQNLHSVAQNIKSCVAQVLNNFKERVAGAVICMPTSTDILINELLGYFPQIEIIIASEGKMGLLAGLCERCGFLTLSGTGSDVFYEGDGLFGFIGGMGILLGDEGSGAYIGQKGLLKAIRAIDGRGPATLLSESLIRWAGMPLTHDNIFSLCALVYEAASPRTVLASFAPYVFLAEAEGDLLAETILNDAVTQLALQTTVLAKRIFASHPETVSSFCTVCGGVWKGSKRFFEEFKKKVNAAYPELNILFPLFEPVVGGAAYIGLKIGYEKEKLIQVLMKNFETLKIIPPK